MSDKPGFQPIQSGIYSGEVDLDKLIDLSVLKGKTILITGGASGFGAACAKHWAKHGANIMIGDVNQKLGTEIVADLRQSTQNSNHHFFTCDVTQWQDQATFFKEAADASPHGGLDIVVANAGIADGAEGALFEGPPDYSKMENPAEPKIMRTIDINLKGVYYTTHLALSYLPRNPGSEPCSVDSQSKLRDRQLILVSSIAGLTPIVKMASYCSSKHGVVGLFRSLRITAPIEHGVRVNMINPYFVQTPLLGIGGNAVLAGGSPAEVESVIDILTRFATDYNIIGRGMIIGPEATQEQANSMNLPHQGPVWDVYADDFGQSDLYTRRMIGLTNLQTQAKGRIGMCRDLLKAFTSPILGRFFG